MFKIKITYETGDSFHNETREEYLQYEWERLDIVRLALQRIDEHYRWYKDKNKVYKLSPYDEVERPEWHKKVMLPEGLRDEESHYLIILELDDRTEVQFSPFWIGYFESLLKAEIVLDEKIEF